MKVLAFDQATTKTGYALFSTGGGLDYGLINLSLKEFRDMDADTKARLMVKKTSELIEELQPD